MTDAPQPAPNAHIAPTPLNVAPKTLAMIVGGGVIAGAILVLGFIFPAEYNSDPLGIGRLTGVGDLYAPDEVTFEGEGAAAAAYASPRPMKTHAVEFELGPAGSESEAMEYKVFMQPNQRFLYTWQASNAAGGPVSDPVEFDFHGHTVVEDENMVVGEYIQDSAYRDTGGFTAPFEGIHGWYFKNHSPEPTAIRIEFEGFFEIVPPGQPGNEAGILPAS